MKKKSIKVSNKPRNQHDDVLAYLKQHGSITQLDCYRRFPAPITRLSAVIFDLRRAGNDIEGVWQQSKNCYGETRFIRYVLHDAEK